MGNTKFSDRIHYLSAVYSYHSFSRRGKVRFLKLNLSYNFIKSVKCPKKYSLHETILWVPFLYNGLCKGTLHRKVQYYLIYFLAVRKNNVRILTFFWNRQDLPLSSISLLSNVKYSSKVGNDWYFHVGFYLGKEYVLNCLK